MNRRRLRRRRVRLRQPLEEHRAARRDVFVEHRLDRGADPLGERVHDRGIVGGLRAVLRHRDRVPEADRKSTRLNSSHITISYAVFCLKKKKKNKNTTTNKTKKKTTKIA